MKIKVNSKTIEDSLENHPEWPSLLSISDSLNMWKVKNAAVHISREEIGSISPPFLTYVNDKGHPVIVASVNDKKVEFYANGKNRTESIEKNNFLSVWTGVCLLVETTVSSGEEGYKQIKLRNLVQVLLPIIFLVVLFTASFYSINQKMANLDLLLSNVVYLQYFVLVIGVVISSELMKYEFRTHNYFWDKVCSAFGNGNCKSVITSKASKLFGILNWSEIGWTYFLGGIVTLVFVGNSIKNALIAVLFINVLALPYVIFSICYQAFIVKKWCVLCLLIQSLLVIGGINALINYQSFFLFNFSSLFFVKILGAYLSSLLLWLSLKPFVIHLNEANSIKLELRRFKYNPDIFQSLLIKQKQIEEPGEDVGILLGNKNATNTLIKVCNPYCQPCSQSHPKIEKLLSKNIDLKIRIIYTTPNRKENPAFLPTFHIMVLMSQCKTDRGKFKILKDWYQISDLSYDRFAQKYPLKEELLNVDVGVDIMDEWCINTQIQYTPTYFFNGYQLPFIYDIDNLHYIM
ncbi:vitamin K epoxide reductase family protein [Labilibaculum manganireducens]|uniref:vitamin K epoxide reductase family protein n=1 Tax=Labilibaculum manganireducens TaxID=1940525 RepID=UPI0015D57326|nr:vitamin K epoxide reductase family protein [Labilibaculum manganireducens]